MGEIGAGNLCRSFYDILLYMANNYSKQTREILKEAGVIKSKDQSNESVAQLIAQTQEERRIKAMTTQNRIFLDEWMKTGNAIQSYKKAYRIKSDFRGAERSAILINKYKDVVLTAMREKMGINEMLYFSHLLKLINAKKILFTRGGGKHIVPDNQARVKALEMLGDLLKLQGKGNGMGGNINTSIGAVNIYKDKEKGIWSVNDTLDGEIVR